MNVFFFLFSYLYSSLYRRTHPITLRIIEIIGGDPILYTMFMKMIRLVFEATPYPSLCSLRVDILMSFHDQDVKQVLYKYI